MQEPDNDDGPTFNKKLNDFTAVQKAQIIGRIAKSESSRTARRSRHSNENLPLSGDKKSEPISRRHARKRRSNEKMGATVVSENFWISIVRLFADYSLIAKNGGQNRKV